MVFWSFRFRSKQCDIGSFLYWLRPFWNVSMCTVVCASPLAVMRYFMPKWFHKGFSVVMDWHFTHLTKKRRNRYGMKFIFFSSLLPNDFDLYYVCMYFTNKKCRNHTCMTNIISNWPLGTWSFFVCDVRCYGWEGFR